MDLTRRNTNLDGLPLATVLVLAAGLVFWAAARGPDGFMGDVLAGDLQEAEVAALQAPPVTPFGDRSVGETLERLLDPPTRVALAAPPRERESKRERAADAAGAGPVLHQHVWDQRGELLAEGFVQGGVPDGQWIFRYSDGRRRAEGRFALGEPEGPWRSWHPDGSPAAELEYVDGQPDGVRVEWWPNGSKSLEGSYHNGLRQGLWRRWHPNGVLRSEGSYHAGLRVGTWREWHDNTRPAIAAEYSHGRRHGTWRKWYYLGVQAEKGGFADGLREGMWYFNEPDGDRDKRTGYYESGVRIRD